MYYVLLTLLIIVALLLILLILIQKGRGGGLSSAFGGGGGSAAFGAKTGDVLTWLTSSFFAVFIVLAVILDLLVNSQYKLTTPKTTASAAIPISAPIDAAPVDTTPTTTAPIDAATTPLVNPAATLGGALDTKLKQATSSATGTLNAAAQKATSATQQAPAGLKSVTQP